MWQHNVIQVLKTAQLHEDTVQTPRAGVIVYPHDMMLLISGSDLSGEVLVRLVMQLHYH